ncbi:MAG: VWA domain-containing protein [Vicinamibacterales bacterium]
MTSRRVSVAALLLAGLAVLPVVLRAQAQQRSVYASALDEKGAPVSGLGPADFVVREDRVAREILNVAPASDPMQIALLIDNSQAADPYVRDLREGATAFINAIAADPTGAKHQVAVITIGERPTINTDYTTDLRRAVTGAQRIFATPGSGAYLLDGIIETSEAITKRQSPRPVIVAVITAGVDLSDRVYQSVLEPLKESGAALHVVVVGRPVTDDTDRMMVLDVGTRDTGGRYDTVLTGTALTPRLKQLGEELTHQYKVTYAHPETLIPPDRITVSAARTGLTVRGIAEKPTSEGRR